MNDLKEVLKAVSTVIALIVLILVALFLFAMFIWTGTASKLVSLAFLILDALLVCGICKILNSL